MKVEEINRELEVARRDGPVRDIVIPPCPELLVALRQEVNKADPGPQEITAIASSDVAMAAALIRVANSPFYARARPASTVSEAVAMLGVGPTINILMGFLARTAIRITSPLLEHFWETSSRRALAMGHIARQLYGVDPELANTCGLFCHVGMPVMLQGLKGYGGTLAEALARQDRSFTETENAAHRTDHAVVGAIVARTWLLPPVIALAVRLHHDTTVLTDKHLPVDARNLVAMVQVADYLVATHEGVGEQREWQIHGTRCLDHLGLSAVEVDAWQDQLHPVFESVVVV